MNVILVCQPITKMLLIQTNARPIWPSSVPVTYLELTNATLATKATTKTEMSASTTVLLIVLK
jgi:hypothetical protein